LINIKDITLGTYVFGESFLHRLDPRIKLGCLLIFVAGIGIGNSWRAFALGGAFLGFACIRSGIDPRYLARSLTPFRWLILVTFLLNVVFTGGHILIEAPLPYGGITTEGLTSGALYSLRLLYLIVAASLLTLTTQPVVLVAGVEKLLEPFSRFGVKSHDIALAMVITIRFIPVLIDEAVKIRKSYIARGFRPKKNIVSRIRGMSMFLAPLMIATIRRAEDLAVAMECRLYRSAAARTRYHELRTGSHDRLAFGITGAASVLMAVV